MNPGPAFEHFEARGKKPDFSGYQLAPFDIPEGRQPGGRLAPTIYEPVEIKLEKYADMVTDRCLPNHTFVIDSGFITHHECPEILWDALLAKKVVIPHVVWGEISSWRAAPRRNHYFHNIFSSGHPNLEIQQPRLRVSNVEYAIEYYVQLLSWRKRVYDYVFQMLLSENGVEPSMDEVRAATQKRVGNRGMRIAKKGNKDKGKSNQFFDEEMLVLAFTSAILSGNDTSVITYDGDLVDQFLKFQYVFDTHYRSMVIAEEFEKQPFNFIEKREHKDLFPEAFEEVSIYSMVAGLPQRILERLDSWVNIHVDRFDENNGNTELLQSHFQADRDMSRLLEIKGKTRGRNTDKFYGKNLHLSIQPKTKGRYAEGSFQGCVAISTDKHVLSEPDVDLKWSVNDFDLTLTPVERTGRTYLVPNAVGKREQKEQRKAEFIANFSFPEKVEIYSETEFTNIKPRTLANSLKLMPPWTRRIICRSFAASPPIGFAEECDELNFIFQLPTHVTDAKNKSNEVKPAILACAASRDEWGIRAISEYYMAVLCYRKMYAQLVSEKHFTRHGYSISKRKLNDELLNRSGGNMYLAALDFLRRKEDLSVFEDEALVVKTVIGAIFEGRESVLITKRPEVVDQFRSLAFMLNHHYLSWAFCRASPDLILRKQARTQKSYSIPPFEYGYAFDVPSNDVMRSVPSNPIDMLVSCWLIEGTSSGGLYCFPTIARFPRPMAHMLKSKIRDKFIGLPNFPNQNLFVLRPSLGDKWNCLMGQDRQTSIGSKEFPADERMRITTEFVSAFDLYLATNANLDPESGLKPPWIAKLKAKRDAELKKKRRKRKDK